MVMIKSMVNVNQNVITVTNVLPQEIAKTVKKISPILKENV